MKSTKESRAVELWSHIHGSHMGILALFSGIRRGSEKLKDTRSAYFAWSGEQDRARSWAERESATGREVYHCAHLLTAGRRIKDNAAPLSALYVDGDGAKVPEYLPPPSAVVESSPGREHFYWRLRRSVPPDVGEKLNRRLAFAIQADRSGWDLTQLLRVPGTHNFKYVGAPPVWILELRADEHHDPADLDQLLPPVPKEQKAGRSSCPADVGPTELPDLCRLSRRMQDLILYGNRGEYPSRSEADMAACLAMFGAGFSEAEVWAVMTDPTNGISEKAAEKGHHGERYLSLTIGKAKARAEAPPSLRRRGKVYARREEVVTLG